MTSVCLLYSRVKELKGNQGHKGQRIYTVPPAKHNLAIRKKFREGSGVAPQGKNLLNIPLRPSNMLDPGDSVFCSTPKRSGREKDAFASARPGKRPGHFTWIRDVQGKCVKGEKRAGGREVRGKYDENAANDTNQDKASKKGMADDTSVFRLGKNSESRNSEKENQQLTLTEDNEDGFKGRGECAEISRGVCAEEDGLWVRCLQGFSERDKERRRHLRQYHQQLQQCWPLSASASHDSLSEQTSCSPSNPLQQLSNISAPDLMCTDLEKELRRRLSVWTGEKNKLVPPLLGGELEVQTESWQRGQGFEAEVGAGDLSVPCNEGPVGEEDALEAAGGGRLRRAQEQKSKEGGWSTGRERGGRWRWAWAASLEVDQMDVGAEVRKDHGNSLGNNFDCIQEDPCLLNEERRSNFQLCPLEKPGRKGEKGWSSPSQRQQGLGFNKLPSGRQNKCSPTFKHHRKGTFSLSSCLYLVTLVLMSRCDKTCL